MTNEQEWVVWNGSLGILDMAALGDVQQGESGRKAYLAPPYDIVGPFSLDELETLGRIAFGECLVMSRRRWLDDQLGLRLQAREKRRRLFFQQMVRPDLDHREILDLPLAGPLNQSDINAAFRRKAKMAHPDAGGDGERYRRIVDARDALLEAIKPTFG
jgi:hypothetical protein